MDDRWGPFPGAYIRRYNQAHPAALEMLNNRGSAMENVGGGLERRSKWEEHGTAREWPFSGDDRGIQRICIETAHHSFPDSQLLALPYLYAHAYTLFHPRFCHILAPLPPSSGIPPHHEPLPEYRGSDYINGYDYDDDEIGRDVLGYIVATPNTKLFLRLWEKVYVRWLRQLQAKYEWELKQVKMEEEEEGEEGEGKTGEKDATITHYHVRLRDLDIALAHPSIHSPAESLFWSDPRVSTHWPAHLHINLTSSWRGRRWGREMIETCCRRLRTEGKAKGVHLGVASDNIGARKFYAKCGFREEEVGDGCVWMVRDLVDGEGEGKDKAMQVGDEGEKEEDGSRETIEDCERTEAAATSSNAQSSGAQSATDKATQESVEKKALNKDEEVEKDQDWELIEKPTSVKDEEVKEKETKKEDEA